MEIVLLGCEKLDDVVVDGVNEPELELIRLQLSNDRENFLQKHNFPGMDDSASLAIDIFEGCLK